MNCSILTYSLVYWPVYLGQSVLLFGFETKEEKETLILIALSSAVIISDYSEHTVDDSMDVLHVCAGRARQGWHDAMHTTVNQVHGCVAGILFDASI